MRAVVMRSYGGPEVLALEELAPPEPLLTEVFVRVRAAGTNPVDTMVRSGALPLVKPPGILGWDVSGIVEKVFPGVTRFRVGDEVFGMPFFPRPAGAYAEYVAAPARQLARKPAALGHIQAAGLPLAGLTAWQGLVDAAGVQPGQRVLIHAASGGVGHLAVQIAKAHGAYVVGTASRAKHDFVRSLGADEVIDYRETDFTEAVRDVDVAFDLVGRDYTARTLEILRPGGALVTISRTNAELVARAEATGRRYIGFAVEPDSVCLERLATLVAEGKLRVHVGQTFPLEEAARAHTLYAGGHPPGKIVLTV
ncbi:NADP-dependent oxidoreductase [Archangium violaceum]|uniref:NADP-dependent oxidoreductase n=1 Tax=Archangium violaceum TaxID=83451 RepID=UPI00194F42A5|nr:NADP-dependent oxidoreductase [Archangium violaceum]QRN98492.1 NADP-dependent oxidoreductase [Archangium violaceum]